MQQTQYLSPIFPLFIILPLFACNNEEHKYDCNVWKEYNWHAMQDFPTKQCIESSKNQHLLIITCDLLKVCDGVCIYRDYYFAMFRMILYVNLWVAVV